MSAEGRHGEIGSLVGDPSAWRDLMAHSRRRRDDRQILGRLLHGWATKRGLDCVALYGHGEDVSRRLAAVDGGGVECPEEIALPAGDVEAGTTTGGAPAQEALDGWHRLELPEATLLLRAQDANGTSNRDQSLSAEDPELLLLAAACRISALKSQIQKHSFQAMFRGVELEVLYEVGLAIASTLDLEGLGSEVLLRAISLLDARRGALYLSDAGDPDAPERKPTVFPLTHHLGGEARPSVDIAHIDIPALVSGRGDGDAQLLPGAEHLLGAPIEVEGATRGLLVVGDKESREGVGPFPSDDRRTLALFASQAAIALENARLHRYALERERLEREMELAAEIQRQLLPEEIPAVPGYDVLGWNRPARHVGGDYFGFQPLADGRWCLIVGDVSGKGVPAALLVSTLHSALSVLLELQTVGPELVGQLNRHVCDSSSANKFITLFLAVLDPATGRLTYLNAGHNPAVIVRSDDSIEPLPAGGLPIGLMPEAGYQAQSVDLQASDLLCIYSDGITECAARDDEEYGLPRLEDLLRAHRDRPLDEILRRIDEAMLAFADGLPQGDDQTVVLARCLA